MLTTTRRRLLAAGLGLLVTSAGGPETPAQRVRVGVFVLELPEPLAAAAPEPGWDWAASGDDVQLLVKGSTTFPSPEMAMASVLAPDRSGRFAWAVTGNPPQPVQGADTYAVWDLRATSGERTGALVAATVGVRTGVLLVHGPRDWSPSLRRGLFAGLRVSRAG